MYQHGMTHFTEIPPQLITTLMCLRAVLTFTEPSSKLADFDSIACIVRDVDSGTDTGLRDLMLLMKGLQKPYFFLLLQDAIENITTYKDGYPELADALHLLDAEDGLLSVTAAPSMEQVTNLSELLCHLPAMRKNVRRGDTCSV